MACHSEPSPVCITGVSGGDYAPRTVAALLQASVHSLLPDLPSSAGGVAHKGQLDCIPA